MMGTELIKLIDSAVKPFIPNQANRDFLHNGLSKLFADKLLSSWCYDDVRYTTQQILTDEQCHDVLVYIRNKHDAGIGINWDVIGLAIEQVVGENDES